MTNMIGLLMNGLLMLRLLIMQTSYWSNAKGLQTGSFARSGEDPSKVFHSVMHYDDKHRVMQTYQVHHKGGSTPWTKTTITNYEYNFAGRSNQRKGFVSDRCFE